MFSNKTGTGYTKKYTKSTKKQNKAVCRVQSAASSKKSKVFPYSLPSVGPGADPGVQAVSPQVT